MPVFDYGDTLYMHASSSLLRPLDAVFHSALRFVTGDGFSTHHCVLYDRVGWSSLSSRREQHCLLFIYKALIGKLPTYLMSLLHLSQPRPTRSASYIRLDIPRVNTEGGKKAFSFFAPDKWNKLQDSLKLKQFISVESFRSLLDLVFHIECTCFS